MGIANLVELHCAANLIRNQIATRRFGEAEHQGKYIVADYATANFWALEERDTAEGAPWTPTEVCFEVSASCTDPQAGPMSVSTFGEAEDGTLYVADLDGALYKMSVSPDNTCD